VDLGPVATSTRALAYREARAEWVIF